jgi:ribosomal protein S18 acetylase RimI-like enzyme
MQERHTGSPAFTLRDAHADEAGAIAGVIQAAYAEYESSYTPEGWQRYFGLLGNVEGHFGRSQIIVAVRDGALARSEGALAKGDNIIAGCVMFYPDGSLSGQGEWPAGWAGMLRLAVHPSFQGHGLGRALTQQCVRRCREAGITTLGLHATSWMSLSRAMYERMGFQRDESFDFVTRSGELAMGYRLEVQ